MSASSSADSIRLTEKNIPTPRLRSSWRFSRVLPLYLMLLPALVFLVLFKLLPLQGISIAFQQYDPLVGFAGSPWVGLENFQRLMNRPDFWQVLRNTLVISLGKIVLGQVIAIVFALMLNEVRLHVFKRVVQSLTYLPYFLSWLVFGAIMADVLHLNGIVNNTLAGLGLSRIQFLSDPNAFPLTVIFTDVLKNFGWNAIIYLAALAAIDTTLYEAAAVDGANRWEQIRYVTLPGITPTIIVLVTLNLGWVLSAGFEQILVMYNPAVYRTGDIIDTFVFRMGLQNFQYSLATAVGLFKSVIGFLLISASYYAAWRLAKYRIF